MDEKDRMARAVSTVLDADVLVQPTSDGAHLLRVLGLSRQPRFHAVWVRRGWPADVRARLDRSPAVNLVVAPELSSGARRLLDERGVNWLDETGAASLRGEGLLVHVDRAPAAKDPQPHGASWSQIAGLAGEATLATRPALITTAWIAEHTGCSIARASRILAGWDEEGWTAKRGPARGRGAHRVLEQPDAMLESWTAHINAMPVERWFAHTTSRDLDDVQTRLAHALGDISFGWTGWAAAQQLAPFVTQLPVLHLRVDERYAHRDLAPRLQEAGLTLTDDAGRIELWRTPGNAFRLATPSPSGPIVSWPRVYADLKRLGGRGEDAAGHLRDVMEQEHG
ncbi:MAG: type IV toxin-antitoxin system AbiEi family antitoxin [Solirubrobacteraceae bacterium]